MTGRYVARHPMTAARELGDTMVVISGGDSRLFTLNDVGALIWNVADGSVTIDAIVDRVCDAYEIDRPTAADDVRTFVDALIAEGILVASDEPPQPGAAERQ